MMSFSGKTLESITDLTARFISNYYWIEEPTLSERVDLMEAPWDL